MVTLSAISDFVGAYVTGKRPSPFFLQHFRANTWPRQFSKITSLKGRKILAGSIVFLADRPSYNLLRRSLALRKNGFYTVLLTRWGGDAPLINCFDETVVFDRLDDLVLLEKININLIHVQAWLGWNFLPVYVSMLSKAPIVCETMDFISLYLKDSAQYHLLDLSAAETEFDLACEAYIFENFPVVLMQYREQVKNKIGKITKFFSQDSLVSFPCYPLESFFAPIFKDDFEEEIKLAYVGTIPIDKRSDEVCAPGKMHQLVNELLGQKFKITIFNTPAMAPTEGELKKKYPYYCRLREQEVNFHFQIGKEPAELGKITKGFHFGFFIVPEKKSKVNQTVNQEMYITKFFTYMELGLPVILPRNFWALAALVEKYNAGIVIDGADIPKLREKILGRKEQYIDMLKGVDTLRHEMSMEKNTEALLTLYKKAGMP